MISVTVFVTHFMQVMSMSYLYILSPLIAMHGVIL